MSWLDKLKQAIRPGDRLSHNRNELVPPADPAELVPEMSRSGFDEKTEESVTPESASVSRLSPREREVFLYLLDGVKMKDIASELHIKTSTVNGYCTQIYKSLGVNSKAKLILQYSDYRKNLGLKGDEQA